MANDGFEMLEVARFFFRSGGRGVVLLGILGGGVPPGSPILTRFQTKQCVPYPFSYLEVVTKRNITCLHIAEIMSSLLELNDENLNIYPIPDQNGQVLYSFSDQNGAKSIPFRDVRVNFDR